MESLPLLIERRVQQVFSVTTTKGHDVRLDRDLTSALDEAGLGYSLYEGPDYMAAGPVDWSRVVGEVVTILGATGGLGGLAAVLKAFWGRHKGTKVKFGENGEVLEADGLSVEDIVRLLERCRPSASPDLAIRDARDAGGRGSPARIGSTRAAWTASARLPSWRHVIAAAKGYRTKWWCTPMVRTALSAGTRTASRCRGGRAARRGATGTTAATTASR
jgi:hypothetical protein